MAVLVMTPMVWRLALGPFLKVMVTVSCGLPPLQVRVVGLPAETDWGSVVNRIPLCAAASEARAEMPNTSD